MGKISYFRFNLIVLPILFLICNANIANEKLCGDPQCENPISLANTILTYVPNKKGFVSFKKGQIAEVFAKSTNTAKDSFWDVKVNNKRGLAPRNMLIENKILVNYNDLIRITVEEQHNKKDSPSEVSKQLKESQPSSSADDKVIETKPIELKGSESTLIPEVDVSHTVTVPLDSPPTTDIKNTEVNLNNTVEVAGPTITDQVNSTPVTEIRNSDVEQNQIIEGTVLPKVDEAKKLSDDGVTVEDDEDSDDDDTEEIEEIYEDDDDDEEYDPVPEKLRLSSVQNSSTESEVKLEKQTDPSLVGSALVDENKGVNTENVSLNVDDSKATLKGNQEADLSQDVENVRYKGLNTRVENSNLNSDNVAESNVNKETQEALISSNIVNLEQKIQSNNNTVSEGKSEGKKNELENNITKTSGETLARIENETTKKEELSEDVQGNGDHKGQIVQLNIESEQPLSSTKHDDKTSEDSAQVITEINKAKDLENRNENLSLSEHDGIEKTTVLNENILITDTSNLNPATPIDSPELSVSTPFFDNNLNYAETTESYITSDPSVSNNTHEIVPTVKEDLVLPSEEKSNSVVDDISNNQIDEEHNLKDNPNIDIITSPSATEPYYGNVNEKNIENVNDEGKIHANKELALENIINFKDEKQEDPVENFIKKDQKEEDDKSGNMNNEGLFANILDSLNIRHGNSETAAKKKLSQDTLFNDNLKVVPDSPREEDIIEENFCFNVDPDNKDCDFGNSKVETANPLKSIFSMLFDNSLLEMLDLSLLLGLTSGTILTLIFCYCCASNKHTKDSVYQKLNITEKNLLASNKEVFILKHELNETKNKLASIENSSFGSNDMVVALKTELKISEENQSKLREQISSLETELENAAEAGLELNKIVSDLLSHQGGDESIISSVEQLQKQLNEQQNTIIEINGILAEKSRENSELQLMLVNQSAKLNNDIENLKVKNEELEEENVKALSQLKEIEKSTEEEMEKTKKEKSTEILSIQNELNSLKNKYEESIDKLHKKDSKIQALEECLKGIKSNSKINIKELLETVNLKAEISTLKKERDSLKERLEGEIDARKLLEDHVHIVSEEVSNLKQEYRQSEKEKLEAKTRLEVLSNYFKEKETQLQKELSVKEAMWLKQQGETTSTVERVRTMQDEIQSLKSQNDSLRAEIEAQTAAHKIQVASLENQAHETWLAIRKSDRKLEEAKSEAALLRRKLTSLVGNPVLGDGNGTQIINEVSTNDLNNIPSPINMESPVSPLIGGLPPPNFLPPPPFMAPPPPPHPFIAMPLPYMAPHEVRSPSMERLMSPPPPPSLHGRYSFSPLNDEDYRDRHLSENGRYSPDNRCNYATDIISTYDTETDFSPPQSPRSTGSKETYNINDFINDRDHNSRNYDRRSSPKSRCSSTNSDQNTKFKGSNFITK